MTRRINKINIFDGISFRIEGGWVVCMEEKSPNGSLIYSGGQDWIFKWKEEEEEKTFISNSIDEHCQIAYYLSTTTITTAEPWQLS